MRRKSLIIISTVASVVIGICVLLYIFEELNENGITSEATITVEEAIEIASSVNTRFVYEDIELEDYNNKPVYVVEMQDENGVEYEVYVDATTGVVMPTTEDI